jgi:DNA-binding MarR family transcriptional regulator
MYDPAKVPTHTAALAVVVGEVLLEPLRTADLVAVTANPHNCRSRVLSLTEAARAKVDRFEQRVVEEVAPIFDDLSDHELRDLADLLGRLETP